MPSTLRHEPSDGTGWPSRRSSHRLLGWPTGTVRRAVRSTLRSSPGVRGVRTPGVPCEFPAAMPSNSLVAGTVGNALLTRRDGAEERCLDWTATQSRRRLAAAERTHDADSSASRRRAKYSVVRADVHRAGPAGRGPAGLCAVRFASPGASNRAGLYSAVAVAAGRKSFINSTLSSNAMWVELRRLTCYPHVVDTAKGLR